MTSFKFKTNINCGSCINAVTPALNSDARIIRWEVDVVDPDKILTVEHNGDISAADVIGLVNDTGFDATEIEAVTTV